MQKRLYLERTKSQLLKDLNRFVSQERLTIHNLPENLTDVNLRKLITKFTNLNPKECRIMRENKPSIAQQLSNSKGFGFISFSNHTDALNALRKLNNNPKVFGKNCRPIVSFSIEDKKAINLKQKRLQKSKLQNPTYQAKLERLKSDHIPGKFVLLKNPDTSISKLMPKQNSDTENFSGLLSKEGYVRSRSKSKLLLQAKKHSQNIIKQRKEAKKKKELEQIKKEKTIMRVPKVKNNDKSKDDFVELYNNYKKFFNRANTDRSTIKKQKWYSES